MMKYLFVPNLQEIPEWKECYYDYQTLNFMIDFIDECDVLYKRIHVKMMSAVKPARLSRDKISTQNPDLEKLRRASLEVRQIMDNWNDFFCEYSEQEKFIIYAFTQYKSFQLHDKFSNYENLFEITKSTKQKSPQKKILTLLENLYIEVYYVQRAIAFNIAKVTQIEHSYAKITNQYSQFEAVFDVNTKLLRMRHQIYLLASTIERRYVLGSEGKNQVASKSLKKLGMSKSTVSKNYMLGIGLAIGVIAVLLIATMIHKDTSGIQLDKDQIFTRHFPVWRGASYVLLYLWVIGLNVLFYQSSQINYKLIFHFDQHFLPHSKFLFMMAGVLSFIYMLLFLLFVMQLSGTLGGTFIYYGELFWALLIAYLFLPLPILQHKGRHYFLKLLLDVIISPCIPMSFLIIWMSEQLVSLNQPFADLFYTICTFTSRDYPTCKKHVPNFSSALIMTMFAWRMLQNFKFWVQISKAAKTYNFKAPPFLGFIRASFGLNTSIAALLLRLEVFPTAWNYWLAMAIITTIVSWIVDVRGDWGLFGFGDKFLRDKLLFPKAKPLYYLVALINLVLRVAWVLSISPFVTKSTGFLPNIFIMIVSYIEILRRGIWNTLRLEFEHIRNCKEYQATIKDGHILSSLKDQLQVILEQQESLKKDKLTPSVKSNSSAKKPLKLSDSHENLDGDPDIPIPTAANLIKKQPTIQKPNNSPLDPFDEEEKKLREYRITKQLQIFKQKLKNRGRLQSMIRKQHQLHKKQLSSIEGRVERIISHWKKQKSS